MGPMPRYVCRIIISLGTYSNVQGMGQTSYGYDGAGRRVWKTNVLGTTVYAYDATGELAAEYSNQSATATGTQYFSADHLGSTRLVTDVNQAVIFKRYDYLP